MIKHVVEAPHSAPAASSAATAADIHSQEQNSTARPTPAADSLATSTLANALGQGAFIITGFILPRVLSESIGVQRLGIWDFGWSISAHLMLVGGGMMSVVSRDVARLAVTGDTAELRRVVSSCFFLFSCLAALVAALTAAFVYWLPQMLPTLPESLWNEGRWAVALLGLSVFVRFPLHVFNGIITGYQRYVLQNGIVTGCHFATVAAAIVVALLGHGIVMMAWMYVLGEVLAGLLKLYYARVLCDRWRIAPRYVDLGAIARVASFGGKTLLQAASRVLMYQSNTMLVGYYLGVEALAIFSRPRSLVLSLEKTFAKMAIVFTPRASAAQARGDQQELRQMLINSTKYSLLVTLPGVIALIILADPLLHVWMGAHFAHGAVLGILAAGHLATYSQRGVYFILVGMGKHGWPAFLELLASLAAIALTALLVEVFGLGLLGAAIGMVAPLTIVHALILPVLACRLLQLSPMTIARESLGTPLLLSAPLAITLLLIRMIPTESDWVTLALAAVVGGAVYLGLLWRFVPRVRKVIRRRRQASTAKPNEDVALNGAMDQPDVWR